MSTYEGVKFLDDVLTSLQYIENLTDFAAGDDVAKLLVDLLGTKLDDELLTTPNLFLDAVDEELKGLITKVTNNLEFTLFVEIEYKSCDKSLGTFNPWDRCCYKFRRHRKPVRCNWSNGNPKLFGGFVHPLPTVTDIMNCAAEAAQQVISDNIVK